MHSPIHAHSANVGTSFLTSSIGNQYTGKTSMGQESIGFREADDAAESRSKGMGRAFRLREITGFSVSWGSRALQR